MFKFLKMLFKDFYLFTAAYSNNIFKDPLPNDIEDEYVKRAKLGDKIARDAGTSDV